ncbi:four-carbon acid sugar kinase family protein [Halobellus ruber]|uniref:Four-carbon acid sugar kinase family protein n=1 Tax=Halobellus ruber TaxID=2761102 RepID=A0A7J9SDU4_9EURY|nr:four-carbon acid sugar kinase family protein [Halobellus ruber]MBB6645095.1 four-carbon acid sugar kinase family protein [Halobellus ruber]
MPALGIVADDLTGAMDTAGEVATRGYDTAVVAVPDASPPEATVVAVNTDSRYCPPAEAAAAVRRGVDALGAPTVYKKIDSTLRGNVGTEVLAALRATAADLAVVAPAFPAIGRRTWNGVHRVDGTPVAETEFGTDRNGPSTSPVADLFGAGDLPVERVDGAAVTDGADRVADRLAATVERHDRPPIVVCDARTDAHLEAIAAAGARFDALFVGSGGLAGHLRMDARVDAAPAPPESEPGTPLGVAGSVSATTLEQLARVPEAHLFRLDPIGLLDGTPRAAADVAARLDRGVPTVVTAATDRSTVEDTLAAGRDRGLSDAEIGDRVAAELAAVAGEACRLTRPAGLFLTGGDVAVAGLRALDATTVSLTGTTVDAGIPVGRVTDGEVPGLPLITKAGGVGDRTSIINCLDALGGYDE